MDNLKKIISSTMNGERKNEILDLLLSDILNRYGLTDIKLKNLPLEKK